MPTFATPEPITLRLKVPSGDIELNASSRQDTEVEVRPSNSSRSEDVELAEQTRVDFRDGTVVIDVPDSKSRWLSRSGSVDVRVALPEGSAVRGQTASADVRGTGRFGDVEMDAASAEVRFDVTGDLKVQCASGDLICGEVDGDLKATSASGEVSVRLVRGNAQVSTASGDSSIGEVHGEARLNAASGDTFLEVAANSVSARTASGDVRIGSVSTGQVKVEGASGDVQIGVKDGTAAWLDLQSLSGDVVSNLEQTDQPGDADDTVEIRVNTISGDILINRA